MKWDDGFGIFRETPTIKESENTEEGKIFPWRQILWCLKRPVLGDVGGKIEIFTGEIFNVCKHLELPREPISFDLK